VTRLRLTYRNKTSRPVQRSDLGEVHTCLPSKSERRRSEEIQTPNHAKQANDPGLRRREVLSGETTVSGTRIHHGPAARPLSYISAYNTKTNNAIPEMSYSNPFTLATKRTQYKNNPMKILQTYRTQSHGPHPPYPQPPTHPPPLPFLTPPETCIFLSVPYNTLHLFK